MSLRFRCLSVPAVLLLSSAASGATYYLSPDGSDADPGTRGHPWQTLAKANAALEPGDTAVLANGEYEGLVEPARSGREGAPITYWAEEDVAEGRCVTDRPRLRVVANQATGFPPVPALKLDPNSDGQPVLAGPPAELQLLERNAEKLRRAATLFSDAP